MNRNTFNNLKAYLANWSEPHFDSLFDLKVARSIHLVFFRGFMITTFCRTNPKMSKFFTVWAFVRIVQPASTSFPLYMVARTTIRTTKTVLTKRYIQLIEENIFGILWIKIRTNGGAMIFTYRERPAELPPQQFPPDLPLHCKWLKYHHWINKIKFAISQPLTRWFYVISLVVPWLWEWRTMGWDGNARTRAVSNDRSIITVA